MGLTGFELQTFLLWGLYLCLKTNKASLRFEMKMSVTNCSGGKFKLKIMNLQSGASSWENSKWRLFNLGVKVSRFLILFEVKLYLSPSLLSKSPVIWDLGLTFPLWTTIDWTTKQSKTQSYSFGKVSKRGLGMFFMAFCRLLLLIWTLLNKIGR